MEWKCGGFFSQMDKNSSLSVFVQCSLLLDVEWKKPSSLQITAQNRFLIGKTE